MNNQSSPAGLRCEYKTTPLGLDEPRPRLSWLMNDPRKGARQTAYQIQVATTREGLTSGGADLWDSGRVETDQCAQVEYTGKKLSTGQRVYWRARTWDAFGVESPWSEPAWWEMGLLRPADWKASWLLAPEERPADATPGAVPCPYFRKPFNLPGPVRRARVYATARGVYELFLNGRRVGDAQLAPGYSDYRKRCHYFTFDVTDLLRLGDNALGGVLSDGWYAGHNDNKQAVFGREPMLLVQMNIELESGKKLTIAGDGSWKSATGAIREADLFMGQTIDARLEMPGWCEPGFDDSAWRSARVEALDFRGGPRIQAHPALPIRKVMELKPVAVTEPRPGVHVFDLGQNMVGWVKLRVPAGVPAGTTLQLRHAEMLEKDGTLYTENLRTARATDRFIVAQSPCEFEPTHTFHGFRYVELTGYDGKPAAEMVRGVVLCSDLEQTGQFECSHPLVNQLQSNIVWGQRGNFLDVPTDCPQRNERQGWLGDAQVFCPTACFNMDVAGFFNKWMLDVDDGQDEEGVYPHVAPSIGYGKGSPAWTDAGVICPWVIYQRYGDQRILERSYPAMVRHIAYLQSHSDNLIRPLIGYGDWLSVECHTSLDVIATAYFAYSTALLSRIADVLGKRGDARKYTRLHKQIKAAFIRRFVTPEGMVINDTQTAYLLALQFDLLPEHCRPAAVAFLKRDILEGRSSVWPYPPRNGHLSTGFVGCPLLNFGLSENGELDLAYKLLLTEDYPSWLFPVKNGATTIWERWDSWTPDKGFGDARMNSFNHYAYGAIGQWLYQVVAGLDLHPQGVGYNRLLIRPRPGGGLTFARASYQSIRGRIQTHWRIESGRFLLDVTLPANTSATVILPAATMDAVTESGQALTGAEGVSNPRVEAGQVTCEVGAGGYRFAVRC